MPLNKLQMLKIHAQSFVETLSRASDKQKQLHATIDIAQDFNRMLSEIATELPDTKDHLPKPIALNTTPMRGITTSTYLDLEIWASRVVKILESVEVNR
jgi:hypothetical protein